MGLRHESAAIQIKFSWTAMAEFLNRQDGLTDATAHNTQYYLSCFKTAGATFTILLIISQN